MNKNLVCLSVGLCLCAGVYPAMAQEASSAPVTVTASKTRRIAVKDYKSFKEYVANEESYLKTKPITTDNGPVRGKMKEIGIELNPGVEIAKSKDRKKIAIISPDKKGLVLINGVAQKISIVTSEGKILHEIPIGKISKGRLGFSNSRLFCFKENGVEYQGDGFEIYDFTGEVVKKVDGIGSVESYMVSNNQKFLAVTSGVPNDGDSVRLYNMEGVEVWKHKVAVGGGAQIKFSQDDKYLLVKMPVYWISGKANSKKLYVFDAGNGGLISEENYEN